MRASLLLLLPAIAAAAPRSADLRVHQDRWLLQGKPVEAAGGGAGEGSPRAAETLAALRVAQA